MFKKVSFFLSLKEIKGRKNKNGSSKVGLSSNEKIKKKNKDKRKKQIKKIFKKKIKCSVQSNAAAKNYEDLMLSWMRWGGGGE